MHRLSITPARVNPVLRHSRERRVSLDGDWGFRLDPDDRGLTEHWFLNPGLMTERITVPGTWQGQGFGGDDEEEVWDFRLIARTLRATYTGTAWYARSFNVPADLSGGRLWIAFGGVHPGAEVWINGVRVGEHAEPFVPFSFDITDVVVDGENSVVMRVHEGARELGFAFSWQGNWSGLYRGVDLVSTGSVSIERLILHPDPASECVRCVLLADGVENTGGVVAHVSLEGGGETEVVLHDRETSFTLDAEGCASWSPDSPRLYRVDAEIVVRGTVSDAISERIGFVTLGIEGKHFLINGEPNYMRGTGEFLPHPETASPDTDRDRLRRKLKALRDYGYNYVRCQSYAQSPEYMEAADEVGLLVQSEMGLLGGWGGHTEWHRYAWPQPTAEWREKLRIQWNHVVLRDVSHPSANIYCMSNELRSTSFPRTAWRCYDETKRIKPSAFVIWTDGGVSDDLPGEFMNAEASADAETSLPVIQHEFRWWSSMPDVRTIDRYDGAVRPYAAEIALKAAARHGVSHVLPQAAENSQRLQFIEMKGKMEACRRENPTLAGICHFNAMDTGPSPQGVISEFFDRKYADDELWIRTNGDTVLLSDITFDGRVFVPGQRLACDLSISDFAHPPFSDPLEIAWELRVGDGVVSGGTLHANHEAFRTSSLGVIEVVMPDMAVPTTARLSVNLVEDDRTVRNAWDLWIMPDERVSGSLRLHGHAEHTWLAKAGLDSPTGEDDPGSYVLCTETLDEAAIDHAVNGGVVLLAVSEGLVRPFAPKLGLSVGRYFFTPPANYPPYEDGHDGTIILDHPMFGDIPHEGFADLQLYRLIAESPPLELEPMGLNDADPVIRPIHSYPVGRSLAYLLERRCGSGRIIISALDLDPAWPEARCLVNRIAAYALAGGTADTQEISSETLEFLRRESTTESDWAW
jgi:beta-galactosidase